MATLAAQLTEKQAELAVCKAAIARIMTGGQSSGIEGSNLQRASLSVLREERTQLEKSINRLLAGGRGIVIDLSVTASDDDSTDVVYTVAP